MTPRERGAEERKQMPIKKSNEVMMGEAKTVFLQRAGELWDEWQERIQEVIENSEGKKINVGFKASLDFSESVASVDTSISFSETVTDTRHNDIDPPEQQQIPGTEREALRRGDENDGEIKEEYVDQHGKTVQFPGAAKPKKAKKKKESAED